MSTHSQPDEPQTEGGDSAISLKQKVLNALAHEILAEIYGHGLTFDETSRALLEKYGKGVGPYLKTGEKKARELIVEDVANLDPADSEKRLALLGLIVRADIRHGLCFAESSAKMLTDFGETVRPYLAEAWNVAHELIAKKIGESPKPPEP